MTTATATATATDEAATPVAEILRLRPYLAAEASRPRRDPFSGATVWTIDPVLRTVAAALAALGSTSRAVARRLAVMRCAGERNNPECCPVVAYLRRQPVGNFRITLAPSGAVEVQAIDGWCESVPLPPAVEWFVARFDRGEFPELATPASHRGDGFDRTVPGVED